MTPQEAFVTRLRRQRQRHQVPLDQIAAEFRIKPELLAAMEANDLSAWPQGLYARAWIREYAAAVGLDPADTVDEFCRLFPQGERRARGTIQEIAAIIAMPSAYRDEFPHDERRRRAADADAPSAPLVSRVAWPAAVAATLRLAWARVMLAFAPAQKSLRRGLP